MITRYALFEGQIQDGEHAAFREAVTREIVPLWKQFPGALAVRVSYAVKRDDGAPEYPMILAISYPYRDRRGGIGQPGSHESARGHRGGSCPLLYRADPSSCHGGRRS